MREMEHDDASAIGTDAEQINAKCAAYFGLSIEEYQSLVRKSLRHVIDGESFVIEKPDGTREPIHPSRIQESPH